MTNWLQRAEAKGTPLIDGETVTFVWPGETAPLLLGDFNDWDPEEAAPMREAAPGVWIHSFTLPQDAFIEYAYVTDLAQAQSDAGRAPDPFNPQTKWNGINASNNIFYMPEAAPTPLVQRAPDVAAGDLTRYTVESGVLAIGEKRDVYLYQPPGAAEEPLPLLVVLDGWDYYFQGKLTAIVDNLIDRGEIRPLAMALVQNGEAARMLEYGASDITLGFLREKVLPLARRHLNLIDDGQRPGAHAILGASMGGLMALYAAWRAPQLFGSALSQSGAFTLGEHDTVLYDLVRGAPPPPIQIWMDAGRFEWLLETNRRMHQLLQERGAAVTYREFAAGHNYYAWRDEVGDGLRWAFGG